MQDNLANLVAGDGVFFKRGDTWAELRGLTPTSPLNGTASAPITFGAYGTGAKPIIDGGGIVYEPTTIYGANACFLANGGPGAFSYITIDGWECRNTLWYGIYFHDYGSPGQAGMPGIVVKNMHIHHTGPYVFYPGGTGAFDDNNYRNQLMFLDETHSADGTQFLNNLVHDCGGHNCIDVKSVTGAVLDSNVVHSGNCCALYLENPTDGTGLAGGADATFSNNVVYGVTGGIECEPNSGLPVTCYIYNNTIQLSGSNSAVLTSALCTYSLTLTVENNIFDNLSNLFYNPNSCGGFISVWDYNDDCGVSGTCDSTPRGPHDIVQQDPKFVNSTGNDYHLQSISPCKDAGTTISAVTKDVDGISRPQGSAYDIGAYEYH